MPSTRRKKAKARRSRETDILLGSGEYNQIHRDIDQMTGFSNIINRDDNEEGQSMRGISSQDNEIRSMLESRNNPSLSRDLDILSGEINISIAQEINSLLNGMNSQTENAISSAIPERIIHQIHGVVKTILSRQLESGSSMSRRPQNMETHECSVDENNLHNRNFRSRQN